MAELAVVIPTRDRRDALLHTLDRLAAQSAGAEVVVVDNGSHDGTPEALAGRPVRVLREPRPGPAAARNAGWRATSAPVVLFLGDDMAPAGDDLLAGHLAAHRADPLQAVLGRATWDPRRPVTPFMHWLEHGGPQFDFGRLVAGPVAPARHFFTANVSVKRELLEALGGFDERFPFAAVEDAELGLRVQRAGGRLEFRPELLVHHDHPTELEAFAARQERAGASAALLHALWPGDAETRLPRPRPWWRAYPLADRAARAALRRSLPPRVQRRLWAVRLMAGYARGWSRAAELVPALA